MKRVTGIGGIFFKAKDPAALGAWYKKHLGIDVQEWGGAAFDWTDESGKPTGVRPHGLCSALPATNLPQARRPSWSTIESRTFKAS